MKMVRKNTTGKTQRRIRRTAFLLFALTAPVLILEFFTPLAISNCMIHFAVFYIAVTALPVAFMAYAFVGKSKNVLAVVLFSTLAISTIVAFFTWDADWKTQTIIYRNRANTNLTIEFRMRSNRFSSGYQKQIVKREKVLPFIDCITKVDTAAINPAEWKKTNQIVNALQLPGEYIDLPNN
jgi:hypothetical protein